MYIIPDDIEDYVRRHTEPPSPLLEELEKETYERTTIPRMLTGPVLGRFLQLLIRLSHARRAIEIGTFTGYGSLMMAEALPEDGILITCEISEEHAAIARSFFARSSHGKKIKLKMEPALETLRSLEGESFDFVFIDADKGSYAAYYEESLRLLRRGGLVVVDNVLWSGRVLNPSDDDSRAIAEFNDLVRRDDRVEKLMLTVRDGLYVIRKR